MHFHPSGAESRMRDKSNMEFSQCFKHLIASAGVTHSSTGELLKLSCSGEGDEEKGTKTWPKACPASLLSPALHHTMGFVL